MLACSVKGLSTLSELSDSMDDTTESIDRERRLMEQIWGQELARFTPELYKILLDTFRQVRERQQS